MSSHDVDHHDHLDPTTGREVVFCHACSNEWYRDSRGLACPSCGSDITEIVEPNNDPRHLDHEHHSSASTSPEIPPFRFGNGDDSDPDEADITEHLGPNRFAFRRSVRDDPNGRHHNPNVDPVLERFFTMIQGFGGPPPRRTVEAGHSPSGPANPEPFSQPRIQRTTFTSGSGTTSVTIVTGPLDGLRAGGSPGSLGPDPFQAIFSNIVRDIGPPEDINQAGPEGTGRGPQPGFASSLHDILSILNPTHGMSRDAVYSQEALDRIITGLMETNPQSNAAPPATATALQNLTRKPVDKEMLGSDGVAECTICIDEMKQGETVIFLPCKHWFHEDCVVLWLKEHNTCPICRTPIEKNDGNNNNNNNNNGNNSNDGGHPNAGLDSARSILFPTPPGPGLSGNSSWFSSPSPGSGGSHEGLDGSQTRPARVSRPPSQSQSRLNEALRSFTSLQREQERDRARDQGTTSGFSYDTSRLQRRSSHSPASPRPAGPEELGARMRQRSPSESSRRSGSDRGRPSGNGPISWLRDRFSGGGSGGGSGSGSPRDGRQR